MFLTEIRNKQILINLVAQLIFPCSKIFPFHDVLFLFVCLLCVFVSFLLIEESEPEQDTKGIFFFLHRFFSNVRFYSIVYFC